LWAEGGACEIEMMVNLNHGEGCSGDHSFASHVRDLVR
jgi:hypothetical protein